MPDGDSKKRVSIPNDTIREIQQSCYAIDDDMRWLVALISDTGMRLAEAAGLCLDDLHLKEIDDDMRWLIALVSDTGMRLGEATGLLKEDIKLNDRIPHLDLKPHP